MKDLDVETPDEKGYTDFRIPIPKEIIILIAIAIAILKYAYGPWLHGLSSDVPKDLVSFFEIAPLIPLLIYLTWIVYLAGISTKKIIIIKD